MVYCENCQKPLKSLVRSYDGLLTVYYCKTCDRAVCVDEVIGKYHLDRLKERLNNTRKVARIELEPFEFDFFWLGRYTPQRDSILDFKRGKDLKVKEVSVNVTSFVSILVKAKRIVKPDVIVPVPQSSADAETPDYRLYGPRFLCSYLSKRLKIKNGTGYLKRVESLSPAHLSEERLSCERHYQTVKCEDTVRNLHVLLFDDVYRTGNTVCGCVKRLVEKGVGRVTLITIGNAEL